MKRMDLC